MQHSDNPPTLVQTFSISERYAVEFDPALHILWSTWLEKKGPYFSPALLQDMAYGISTIEDGSFSAADQFQYFVLRSASDHVFNLGGDLALFREMIVSGNREGLLAYARLSADMMFALYSGMGKGATTIALVQGNCLGGGFEAAVACDYLFAEHGTQFCFPEIQLGIFPGMGALPILARRVSRRDFDALCHSGRTFSAEQLHAMGVIDLLVKRGGGEQAVVEFVKSRRQAPGAHRDMLALRKAAEQLTKEDFHAALDDWTKRILALDKRRLAMLELALLRQHAQ